VDINVDRTFSMFHEENEASDQDYGYWFHRHSVDQNSLSWPKFSEKRVVVILGEAGIGKTYEFKAQSERLKHENKPAFFIPLNQITNQETYDLALSGDRTNYDKWLSSGEMGYFFLDSVDETRLNSSTSLNISLKTIIKSLRPQLKRASFFVSSRITDWSFPGVKETIEETVLKPVQQADTQLSDYSSDPTGDLTVKENKKSSIQLEVFSLDPLSRCDVLKFAKAYGAVPVDKFWEEIEDGDYEFMATRPLDLRWMAERWSSLKKLGSYSELIESAVQNRLKEHNPSYIETKSVLSEAQLRQGVEQIAAASVLSGYPYILITPGVSQDGAISPAEVLSEWKPTEHLCLLGSAIFDESTYGRVKFHHRIIREYLAACWIEKLINDGLPVQKALELFIRNSFGEQVLLRARRPVLCWLASINAVVRERVIQLFPEMLMFEGDPQHWSSSDVEVAFEGYLSRLESGYQPDWWNDASEFRRVAQMLSPTIIEKHLSKYSENHKILNRLLTLIKHGKISACSALVYDIYNNPDTIPRHKNYALITLDSIASPEQRKAISGDLVSGVLKLNMHIASALVVTGLENLTVEQLTKVFAKCDPEPEYGGSLSRAVEDDILPKLSFESALVLLESLLHNLKNSDIEQIQSRVDRKKSKEAWLLQILPKCLLHAIGLIKVESSDLSQILVDVAVYVAKTHSYYSNDKEISALRSKISEYPKLRRSVALAIAFSEDIRHGLTSLMSWHNLVTFDRTDLNWLVEHANRIDLDTREQDVWYQLARDIALYRCMGKQRRNALDALMSGPEVTARTAKIKELKTERIEALRKNNHWKYEDRECKREKREQLETNKSELLSRIEQIRSGEDTSAIIWLTQFAAERDPVSKYIKPRIEPIHELSSDLAVAYDQGLKTIWRLLKIQTPAEYPDNRVPWTGIVGLASLNFACSNGFDILSISDEEACRAISYCVWDYDKCDPWVESLAIHKTDAVVAALMPWYENELETPFDYVRILRTVDFVLDRIESSNFKTTFFQNSLSLINGGKVPNEQLQRKLLGLIIDAGIEDKGLIGSIASKYLVQELSLDQPTFAKEWFTAWASYDFENAYSWFEKHSQTLTKNKNERLAVFAEALKDASWLKNLSGTDDEVRTIISVYKFLTSDEDVADDDSDANEQDNDNDEIDLGMHSPVRELINQIPGILRKLPGKTAHMALAALSGVYSGTDRGHWLKGIVVEHATSEAEIDSGLHPSEIPFLGECYCHDARNTGELYEQVLARLEDIRESIEKGPFSDRGLFSPGIDETKLQIWLASRLSDTPRRRFITRFVVHREPQVDHSNRTDIEVSSHVGKVCIEIKPLDSSRSYSANSLVKTLKTQLVGQYLRGQNSSHGILVLVRLDGRKWKIPGGQSRGTYDDLIRFLKGKAEEIEKECSDVESLSVVGIDCL